MTEPAQGLDNEFGGHTVVVTGAAGDLGRAAAVSLADAGATLILADLDAASDRLAETVALCPGDGHQLAFFDVTDADQVRDQLATAVAASGGVVHGLFNNAGYQGHFAALTDQRADDVRRVLEVNVLGVFNVMVAAAAHMSDGGAIVNTASMAGVSGAPNMAPYSASKAAVIGLTKSAAKDLAPKSIRVNAVSPAFIGPGTMWDTQVAAQAGVASRYYSDDPETVASEMIGSVPMDRFGSPQEVADVVQYLLSERASYLTGINIEIAGGAT